MGGIRHAVSSDDGSVLGVVHRDLKPANILFRRNGAPVIIDLGLAKSVDVPIVPDGVSIVDGKAVGVGTPEYAAPEQFTGGDITPASDVHALGVLAEKLTTEKPEGWFVWGGGVLARAEWKKIIRRPTLLQSPLPYASHSATCFVQRTLKSEEKSGRGQEADRPLQGAPLSQVAEGGRFVRSGEIQVRRTC